MITRGTTPRGIETVTITCDGGCGRVIHAVGAAGRVRMENAQAVAERGGEHLCAACNDQRQRAIVQIPHPEHG